MDEKNHEGYVSTEGQKEPDRTRFNTNFKSKLKVGAAILGLLAVTSCDSFRDKRDDLRGIDPMEKELKEEIKQQKKEARYEKRLNDISYTLKVKIKQRKKWVIKYTEKLEECKRDPNNLALKERTLQICQEVGKYNREIKSLAEDELNISIKLDDIRSRPQSGLPTGPAYTRADYFDFIIEGEEQEDENNTANYFDFNNENNGNMGNDGKHENNSQGCREETLENLVKK